MAFFKCFDLPIYVRKLIFLFAYQTFPGSGWGLWSLNQLESRGGPAPAHLICTTKSGMERPLPHLGSVPAAHIRPEVGSRPEHLVDCSPFSVSESMEAAVGTCPGVQWAGTL